MASGKGYSTATSKTIWVLEYFLNDLGNYINLKSDVDAAICLKLFGIIEGLIEEKHFAWVKPNCKQDEGVLAFYNFYKKEKLADKDLEVSTLFLNNYILQKYDNVTPKSYSMPMDMYEDIEERHNKMVDKQKKAAKSFEEKSKKDKTA